MPQKLFNMAKELGEGAEGSPAVLTRVMLASANVCGLSGQQYFEIEDGKIDRVALDDIESVLKEVDLPENGQVDGIGLVALPFPTPV